MKMLVNFADSQIYKYVCAAKITIKNQGNHNTIIMTKPSLTKLSIVYIYMYMLSNRSTLSRAVKI